jgi:hypothetical protein
MTPCVGPCSPVAAAGGYAVTTQPSCRVSVDVSQTPAVDRLDDITAEKDPCHRSYGLERRGYYVAIQP